MPPTRTLSKNKKLKKIVINEVESEKVENPKHYDANRYYYNTTVF